MKTASPSKEEFEGAVSRPLGTATAVTKPYRWPLRVLAVGLLLMLSAFLLISHSERKKSRCRFEKRARMFEAC